MDYDDGVRYSRVSEWREPVGVLPLDDRAILWFPPEGMKSPLLRWARYSLGAALDPPPLTCVTLVARMLGLPRPWPRRPVELVSLLRAS